MRLLPRGVSLRQVLLELNPLSSCAESLEQAPREWRPFLESERLRLEEMSRYELAEGFKGVAGADEVGRGPMAGPLVAAATAFAEVPWIPGLRDSKQLSEEEREAMLPWIKAKAKAWACWRIPVDVLNAGGSISRHSLEAMRRSALKLGIHLEMLLIDGISTIPDMLQEMRPVRQRSLIKGDRLSVSIAAASVVAKVTRDREMEELDAVYPNYGFARHKGYCTAEHQAALERFGVCPQHRLRFANVRRVVERPACQGELFT